MTTTPSPTLQPTPSLHIDLLPHGAPGDPIRAPAVRIHRGGGFWRGWRRSEDGDSGGRGT